MVQDRVITPQHSRFSEHDLERHMDRPGDEDLCSISRATTAKITASPSSPQYSPYSRDLQNPGWNNTRLGRLRLVETQYRITTRILVLTLAVLVPITALMVAFAYVLFMYIDHISEGCKSTYGE